MEEDQFDINTVVKLVGKGHTIGWTARKMGVTSERVAEALSAWGRLRDTARSNGGPEEGVPAAADLTSNEEEELRAIGLIDGTAEQARWLARKGWKTADIARKLGKRYQQVHHVLGRVQHK